MSAVPARDPQPLSGDGGRASTADRAPVRLRRRLSGSSEPPCQRGAVQPSTTAVSGLRTVVERVQRFRASTFGPASEEPYRRRTSDWIRVVVAAALLLIAAQHAGGVTVTEQAIFDFFNSAPSR